jgi:DNA repair photolyase
MIMSKVQEFQRSVGVTKSEEFNNKQLATYAINGGLICGHGCAYCSTPSLLRTHALFRDMGISSFQYFAEGGSVVDPWTAIRVGRQIRSLTENDMVMISTITDCWSPEAQKHNLGRKILEQVLINSKCQVRVLTKNAAVQNDFDIIKQFGDRIRIGLSITSPISKENIIKLIEPNASLMSERIDAMKKAKSLGIKTFGMICPVLPGIGNDPESYKQMLSAVLECDPEAIWTEPLNPRGPGIARCMEILDKNNHSNIAAHFDMIRNSTLHMDYVENLINMATNIAKEMNCIDKLKILIYSNGDGYRVDDQAVIWLK